jgi:hypothetical protein
VIMFDIKDEQGEVTAVCSTRKKALARAKTMLRRRTKAGARMAVIKDHYVYRTFLKAQYP